MSKNKAIITLGILVAIQPLPIFGFPTAWEAAFQIAAGVLIVLISVWAIVDKKLSHKAKAQERRRVQKRMAEPEAQTEGPAAETLEEKNS